MTKKRPKRQRRGDQPPTLRQVLELLVGPREPGSVPEHLEEKYPRWSPDTFDDDEHAKRVWKRWRNWMIEMEAIEPDEIPEWLVEEE